MAARIARKLTGSTPWRYVSELKTSEYPVFSNLGDVPRGVFGNKNLVVEKFLPEIEGDGFAVRYYWFCGDREISFRLASAQTIIKVSNASRIEQVPVPPELRRMRQQMGFDYGKFDYVVQDGKVVLFDANRTPGGSFLKHAHCQPLQMLARYLADGIWSLLDRDRVPQA
jgi:hypothetical protein